MYNYDYSMLTGEVITKDNFEYEESRKCWNRAIEKYPLIINYCNDKEDVSNAIKWARKNAVPFRIRSGCHNYEGFSTGNDLFVIDVSRINSIFIDEDKNYVKLGGGVRNREIYEALGKQGYPFPGGGCPTVGVSGLILGGGWGYSTRLFGLSCDTLIELELVNYDGEVIIASEKENSDLFWACRGAGGGNFGVIVSMKFALPNKMQMATLINGDFNSCDIEETINLISAWQDMYKNLDKRFNGKMSIYNSQENGRGVKFTALLYGDKKEANQILEPLKRVSSNSFIKMEYGTVLEANRKIQDSHPEYESYKSSGRFVYKEYSRSEIEELSHLIETRAEGAIYTAITFYGLGGAVMDVKKEKTAFYYRDAKFIMGFQSVWEEAKYAPVNRRWFLEKFNYIKSITEGSFINFPLLELENYKKEYFGENVSKLVEIKSKYDPLDVFKFQQGIID